MYTVLIYENTIPPSLPPNLPEKYFNFITARDHQQAILACLEHKPALMLCSLNDKPADVLELAMKLQTLMIPVEILACASEVKEDIIIPARASGIVPLECAGFNDELMLLSICQRLSLPYEAILNPEVCLNSWGKALTPLASRLTLLGEVGNYICFAKKQGAAKKKRTPCWLRLCRMISGDHPSDA